MNAVRALCLVLLVALTPRGALALGTPRGEQGRVVARIVVEQGDVYLQTRTGRPIVVPGQLSLREGDVLTTPASVRGRFELARGGVVALSPLKRYRVGANGLQEPAGSGWRPLDSVVRAPAPVVPEGQSAGGLIAKVRLLNGFAYHRPRGWPQEIPARGGLSLGAGDELRLSPGTNAQVQLVEGGWLYLTGPALAAFYPDTINMESGAALAKSLGRATVALGPYRIHGGARVFSFASAPNRLVVNALTGVLTVQIADAKPLYLAPGRTACLIPGKTAVLGGIAIRPEIQEWEARFNPNAPRPVRPEAPADTNDVVNADPTPKREKPPGLKKVNPDGEGPERRSGPPDPRVEDPHPIAVLSLRDRIHAMESPTSREFYVRKRTDRETAAEYKTFQEQAGPNPDEVTAFRLFKLSRAQAAAHRDLDDYRTGRELSFNERPYKLQQAKDGRVRTERERLFGEPLFLETRRLLLFAGANRATLITAAEAATRDILIARTTGAPSAAIADLVERRQNLLTLADEQTDGIKELIRISMEPYR